MTAKRKHRATGKKPPGGRRDGAGRPEGSLNTLELGEVKAIRAAKLRIPAGTPPALEGLAHRALIRIADVMNESVSSFQGRNVLSAATRIREEVCGPLAQKVQHMDADGGKLVVEVRTLPEESE